MTQRRSVSRRLRRGLGIIGLIGTVLLLAAVAFFYSFTFTHLDPQAAMMRAIKEMLEHVALPLIVLLVPVTIMVLRVIRQAFVPLAEAAAEIEAARGHERGFRIDASQMPAEAVPFTEAVNDLLTRLDESARRQEAFAADVAHELRTPLALLSLELDRLHRDDAVRLKTDVAAMRRLIDQLMLLAQIDADAAAQIAPELVSLADVASDVIGSIAPGIIAEGKMISLDADERAPIVNHHLRVPAAQHLDPGADAAGVGRREPDRAAEERAPAREPSEVIPGLAQEVLGCGGEGREGERGRRGHAAILDHFPRVDPGAFGLTP